MLNANDAFDNVCTMLYNRINKNLFVYVVGICAVVRVVLSIVSGLKITRIDTKLDWNSTEPRLSI